MPHVHELVDYTVTGYIVNGDAVLLIHHKKYDIWLPPGGHVELDENPEEALLREIKEEVGLDIVIDGEKPKNITERSTFLHVPAYLDIHRIDDTHQHIGMHYFCTSKTRDFTINDEVNDAKWFTKADIKAEQEMLPETAFHALSALDRLSR